MQSILRVLEYNNKKKNNQKNNPDLQFINYFIAIQNNLIDIIEFAICNYRFIIKLNRSK